jgi:hypothetical protein
VGNCLRDRGPDVDEREVIGDLDGADDRAGHAGFVRDRADQVARPDPRPPPTADEELNPLSARRRRVAGAARATRWTPPGARASLVYTTVAADDLKGVDLGGRRIIK